MEQYIPKSALVAEIERLWNEYKNNDENNKLTWFVAKLENFLNTIEVKEVDLDAELEHYKAEQNIKYEEDINMFEFAEHFFELGLKTQKGK